MTKDGKDDTKCSISSDNESMTWSINRYDLLIDGEIYKFIFNNDIELELQSEVEKRN